MSESKRRVYLFCYNLFMFSGFLYAFLVMSIKYSKVTSTTDREISSFLLLIYHCCNAAISQDPEDFVPRTYETMGNCMKVRTCS